MKTAYCSVFFEVTVSPAWPQDAAQERLRKTIYFIHRDSPHTLKEAHGKSTEEEAQPSGRGAERMRGPATSALTRVGGGHKKRHEGISQERLKVTRSQSGEGRRGNFWQRPTLSHWCTWLPGRSSGPVHGMSRQQEDMKFKIYNTQQT